MILCNELIIETLSIATSFSWWAKSNSHWALAQTVSAKAILYFIFAHQLKLVAIQPLIRIINALLFNFNFP
jgi:hypothetical protein